MDIGVRTSTDYRLTLGQESRNMLEGRLFEYYLRGETDWIKLSIKKMNVSFLGYLCKSVISITRGIESLFGRVRVRS